MTSGNIDTAPDGFYAVCSIGRGGVSGYFWAAWWTSSGLVTTPTPDAHGLADKVEEAHAHARAAILKARGPRAAVLQVEAELGAQAARLVRPASEGYYAGAAWWGDDPAWQHGASSRARSSGRGEPGPRGWLAVLELSWPCSAADVRRAYRRLALQRHPDHGGTNEAFTRLTEAYELAVKEVGRMGHANGG
jgi:hypothetical protein